MAVRKIERVLIVDPFETAAQRLADDISTWPDAPNHPGRFAAGSRGPGGHRAGRHHDNHARLFDGNDLKPGTHVTGVGSFTPQMQEIDATTIRPGAGGGGPAGCGHGRGRGHHYRQGDDRCGDR
jgi:hypothetical protein